MKQATYTEIATDWALWTEYVDADGTMTREEFDALTIEQKVALQVEAFGAELKRFILISPRNGYIYGDVQATTPINAARVLDQQVDNGRYLYSEHATGTEMADSYLVYDASGSDMAEVTDGQDADQIQRANRLPFVCIVMRERVDLIG